MHAHFHMAKQLPLSNDTRRELQLAAAMQQYYMCSTILLTMPSTVTLLFFKTKDKRKASMQMMLQPAPLL